ncbi:DUF4360 domain-containing protein [Cryptosporangium japonicum]|uniref:DUF4360 domain-containing protein n=1 Tax=Cryptosporangium japonicum TaxID=80872 RepID=A0ABN0V767_9ACTN
MLGRRWGTAFAAFGILAVLFTTAEPGAATVRSIDPPNGQFTIDVHSVHGNGCPPGTAKVVRAGDRTAFTVTYSNYTAQNGGGIAISQRRAACTIAVDVGVPHGFTFGITRTTFRGFADLAEGATGRLDTQYWFVGMDVTGKIRRDFTGELQDNWQATDEVPLPEVMWMPCRPGGVPLNIESSLTVNAGRINPGTTSLMTMDATDSEVTTIYNIAWREC